MPPPPDEGPPAGDADRAPLFEALRAYQGARITPLHTPAHKGTLAPDGLGDLLTPLGLACDLPAMDATDYLFNPKGCIAEAQGLAAALWGASATFFLAHGSTIGVQAMMMAAVRPGEKIVLSRNVHLSALSALVLSGARPVFLPSRWMESAGPLPAGDGDVEDAFARHPDARAVFLTHPSYYGIGSDLRSAARSCARHGVPLLVDEAHGAHLRFLPPGHVRSALEQGADAVVQSVHKTVGSLIGTAQLHLGRGGLIEPSRMQQALNLLESTSSSYLLLASLDLSRRHMGRAGRRLFGEACDRAARLRRDLDAVEGIRVLGPGCDEDLRGCAFDPLRLVVDVSGLGQTGFAVERRLQREFGLLDEFSDGRNVVFVLGPADAPDAYPRLAQAFREIARRAVLRPPAARPVRSAPLPPAAMTPRRAAFEPARMVPLRAAEGSVCAEMISMYPPGIPILCPGERFTPDVLDYIGEISREAICIYARDPSLATVSVVAT